MSEVVRRSLAAVVEGRTLDRAEARLAMGAVMDGEATTAQLAALLVALRMRGETVDELVGFAQAMRERVLHVAAPPGAIDIVGTGGDGRGTFNISTASAIVVAAAGVPVAKHGNRAITSQAGSFDVLEALGVVVEQGPEEAAAALGATGFAFLFAPAYHPAMRHAGPTRREIGVRTAFNLLGPLTNPAGVDRQLLGVAELRIAERLAAAAGQLGMARAFVVAGDRLDELPLDGSGVIWDVRPEGLARRQIDLPTLAGLGLAAAPTEALVGGSAAENAALIEEVFAGRLGPARDVVLLNAGAGLEVAGQVPGLAEGVALAARLVDEGAAAAMLARLRSPPADRGRPGGRSAGSGSRGRGGPVSAVAARPRPSSGHPSRSSLLAEIAARRAADVAAQLGATTYRESSQQAEVGQAPAPRDVLGPLLRPGLHLIAEVKRRSPSAGRLADADSDPAARARAYERGGAAVISVLCEPHWFGGSLADLRAVRRAVSVPVLAKEFVVDPRQLPLVRAAGADAVLLIAALHPRARLGSLIARALDLGLEPLVEAHDARELDRALQAGARLVGLNNRDLRTLAVDPERAARLRERLPDDRLAVVESGLRRPADMRAWRALGFDAALVGEALMRAGEAAEVGSGHAAAAPSMAATAIAALAAAFVAAGRAPSVAEDPAAADRTPFVKICAVTDVAGALAAVRAGADALGLNFVPGTRRALELGQAEAIVAAVRQAAGAGAPQLVGVFADRPPRELASIAGRLDLDAIQLNGDEPPEALDALGRPCFKVLHLPEKADRDPAASAAAVVARARAYLARPNLVRLLLDTADQHVPGGTGRRADPAVAALVAREVPITLAGGLDPANVTAALRTIPARGVDVASGVEARASRAGFGRRRADRLTAQGQPRKDARLVGLFVKRAKAARLDRPLAPARPCPVHPGLLEADDRGRWGTERQFGGRYVPETIVAALEALAGSWLQLRDDPRTWAELGELRRRYIGAPSPIYRADRLAAELEGQAGRAPGGLRLWLKREDLNHTGAHKITNALGQAWLTRRLGKQRVIAETGAGQHGVATATACALLDLPCVVYMGAEDIRRQAPNVERMRALGAEVREVRSGSATLKDAVSEALRDWVTNVATTHYVLGSAVGPHPYPTIVRDLQRSIGDDAAAQLLATEGRLPDAAVACLGGGSNGIGLFSRFIGEPSVRLVGVEAAGEGVASGRHAAALAGGRPGILHGARSYLLQDDDGQVLEAVSISAGLDYPGIGPHLAALYAAGRLEILAATDAEALAGLRLLTRSEGILPALEPAHAIAALPALLRGDVALGRAPLPVDALVLLGLSGRGDKDLAMVGQDG